MGDEIAHMGIINGTLCLCFPSIVGGCIVWEDTNDVNVVYVFEGIFGWINKFPPKDKMQALCYVLSKIKYRWMRLHPKAVKLRVKLGWGPIVEAVYLSIISVIGRIHFRPKSHQSLNKAGLNRGAGCNGSL